MKYYPIYLNLKGGSVLLVGAGDMGLQKIKALLSSQAKVHVVAKDALPIIAPLGNVIKILWNNKPENSWHMQNPGDGDIEIRGKGELKNYLTFTA